MLLFGSTPQGRAYLLSPVEQVRKYKQPPPPKKRKMMNEYVQPCNKYIILLVAHTPMSHISKCILKNNI